MPFVLTTEDVGQYNLTYVGRQKVDEVDCYVFDVAPKVMEKGKRYLLKVGSKNRRFAYVVVTP